MYADAVVRERLETAKEELGWALEYHSVSEVEDFDKRLQARYQDAYQIAQQESQGTNNPPQAFQVSLLRSLCNPLAPKLSTEEVRFMQNERALVSCDAAYFMTRYYFIKTPQRIQRFTFLPAQMVYFNVIAEMESRGAPIELICAKARQHGVSTATEGLTLHRICTGYGVNAVVASADRVMTQKMGQMMFLAYDLLPWWLRPLDSRRVESDQGMLVFGGLRSGVSFQHGGQTSGIARGDTVSVYHLSEISGYADAGTIIEDALFKCVHAHPNVFGVLESTAAGDTGWWYDTYWHAKKEWRNGKARLCPLFLPWFMGTDKYPTRTWIKTHPIPGDWAPEPETREMAARAELYVKSNPVLEKVIGKDWRLPKEQGWFWEASFLELRAKGREKMWFQEMPTDDKEAFQGSYDSVFGREVIAEVFSKRAPKYKVFGIIGQSIEQKHEPLDEEIDWTQARVMVNYKSPRGQVYRWELIPLQWKEKWSSLEDLGEDDSWEGKLFVFLEPESGYDYAIGVDTSSGQGRDSSCIAVSRRARDNSSPDRQAAELRSSTISHVEAYAFVMAVASYYSRFSGEPESLNGHREPYVAIEQVAAVGDTCNAQMKLMGYGRFHKMVRYDGKTINKVGATRSGWYTQGWSRPVLTDTFVHLVQNGWYEVNSPWTIWEMDHWEVHLTASGKEKKEHSSKATDDGIFANAMAAFCPNDTRSMTERTKKKRMDLGEGELPAIDIAPWNGRSFSPSGHGTLDRPRVDLELEGFR